MKPWEMNWKNQNTDQSSQKPWEMNWTQSSNSTPSVNVDPTKPDVIDSVARGFTQGATLGFADEIAGAGEAAGKAVFGNDKLSDIADNYTKYRNESRANFKKAEQANPGAYMAGEVGGALATTAVPFGAATTLSKAALAGARAGVIGSVGASEADSTSKLIEDAGLGAATGAAGGSLGYGATKAIGATKSALSSAKTAVSDAASNIFSKESKSIPIGSQPDISMNSSAVKDAYKSAQNRIKSYFNPEVDPKFSEFADIAKKIGIDPKELPESIKFGPDSSASRAARSLAEGKFGEESLKKFNSTLGKVQNAYTDKIKSFSKGAPIDEVTAGNTLRQAYDEGVSKFFDQMDITHNTIMEMAPGMKLTDQSLQKIESSLNGVEKFAKGRLERGVTKTQKEQGQQLLSAVEAIRSGNGSYKQTTEALRDIGEAAFQSKNSLADIPVDTQKMRKIYNDLNESLIDTVRSRLGNQIADGLVENNKLMSEFFGEKSLVSKTLGDKAISPETAFKSLLLNGDSQKINALKKVVSPEQWDYLKGAVLENIVKRNPEGDFTFKQLFNSMRGKKSALDAIFTPQELSEIAGIVRLGDRFGSPVLSSSGTGASLSFQDITKSAGNLSVDALAIRNANKAAEKSLNKSTEAQVKELSKRPVAETLSKAAGVYAGAKVNKGPGAWIESGGEKLLKHDSSITPQQIEELKKTKRGRDLLIQASDFTPGSKAMDNLLQKVRMGEAKGGE